MVIARLLLTALLLEAAQVLTSGKPTMDSRRILELALDLENGKRPCAEAVAVMSDASTIVMAR
jgi:hypothetical protein